MTITGAAAVLFLAAFAFTALLLFCAATQNTESAAGAHSLTALGMMPHILGQALSDSRNACK